MTEIKPIIEKYLAGKASKEEQLILLDFLREGEANQRLFQKAKTAWQAHPNKSFTLKEWEAWSRVHRQITAPIQRGSLSKFWINTYRAASIIAIVLLVGIGFGVSHLNNQTVIVSTKPGQNLNLLLPDSSRVMLNSSSSLVYHPLAFAFNRKVELEGEAYFEVTKQSLRPFLVRSNDLKVKVLGTQFNVNAYPETGKYEVVLEEGSVHVSMTSFKDCKTTLSPGQKTEIDRSTGEGKLSKVNTRLFTAWTEGVLYFYDSRFSDVVTRLERRYGVNIELSDPLIKDFVFSTTIRNEPFEEVLDLVQEVLPVTALEDEGIIRFTLDEKRYRKYLKEKR